MKMRRWATLVATVLAVGTLSPATAAPTRAITPSAKVAKPHISSDKANVTVGGKYHLTVKVSHPRSVERVALETQSGARWQKVSMTKGNDKSVYTFARTSSGFGILRIRGVVTRKSGDREYTSTVRVNRWNWVNAHQATRGMSGGMEYRPGETDTWTTPFSDYEFRGRQVEGIGSRYPVSDWELTLHVNGGCKRVIGFAAVDDNSSDESGVKMSVRVPDRVLKSFTGSRYGVKQQLIAIFPRETYRLTFSASQSSASEVTSFFGGVRLLCDRSFSR